MLLGEVRDQHMGQLLGSEKTHLLDQELNKVLIYLQVKKCYRCGQRGHKALDYESPTSCERCGI
jgi:hypothetical protein